MRLTSVSSAQRALNVNRVLWIGFLAGLLAGPGVGCGRETPTIAVGRTSLDLGEIPQRAVQTDVRVANVGRGTLRILAVKTSCGCTRAWVSDSVLAPGGATTLTVHYDPTAIVPPDSGRVQRGVYLLSNDPLRPEIEFALSAVVRPCDGG